jgi:phage shock protein A
MRMNELQSGQIGERLKRIEEALQKKADLESTLEGLESKLGDLPEEVDDLRGELADAESRIDDLESGDWP